MSQAAVLVTDGFTIPYWLYIKPNGCDGTMDLCEMHAILRLNYGIYGLRAIKINLNSTFSSLCAIPAEFLRGYMSIIAELGS